jgi:hypothetical protein
MLEVVQVVLPAVFAPFPRAVWSPQTSMLMDTSARPSAARRSMSRTSLSGTIMMSTATPENVVMTAS